VEVLIPAPRNQPLMTWVRDRAVTALTAGVRNGIQSRPHRGGTQDLRTA
jgi:hypothetical protein